MSIHVSNPKGMPRRIVLSCDVAGCAVQVEPRAAEQWRSDPDARSFARENAVGWTFDRERGTDYCPTHAARSVVSAGDVAPPRPTATVRDPAGNPRDRDEYATHLRGRLGDGASGRVVTLTAAQAEVAARLLDELEGVYRGENLGALAHDVSALLGGPS